MTKLRSASKSLMVLLNNFLTKPDSQNANTSGRKAGTAIHAGVSDQVGSSFRPAAWSQFGKENGRLGVSGVRGVAQNRVKTRSVWRDLPEGAVEHRRGQGVKKDTGVTGTRGSILGGSFQVWNWTCWGHGCFAHMASTNSITEMFWITTRTFQW